MSRGSLVELEYPQEEGQCQLEVPKSPNPIKQRVSALRFFLVAFVSLGVGLGEAWEDMRVPDN